MNKGIVDLHGLNIKEAQHILYSLLCTKEGKLNTWVIMECARRVKVITGAGRHSEGGVVRLLPAIKHMFDSGYLGSVELKYKEIYDRLGAAFGLEVDVTPLVKMRREV